MGSNYHLETVTFYKFYFLYLSPIFSILPGAPLVIEEHAHAAGLVLDVLLACTPVRN